MTGIKLFSVAILSVLATACGAQGKSSAVPEGAHVDILQTEQLVLRGSSPTRLDRVACDKAAPAAAQHLLELRDDTNGSFRLRPAAGERGLQVAMLHITNLDSNRTWCAVVAPDGSPALIPGGFPSGTYAISVSAASAGQSPPPRYEVVVQRL